MGHNSAATCLANKADECPVCLETFDYRIRTVFPCGHFTCMTCLSRIARHPACPMCRADLTLTVCWKHAPSHRSVPSTPPAMPPLALPLPLVGVPARASNHGRRTASLFSSFRQLPQRRRHGVQPNRETVVVFDIDETSGSEGDVSDLPVTTRSMLASIRVRPLRHDDLLNARVTRRSVFLRSPVEEE